MTEMKRETEEVGASVESGGDATKLKEEKVHEQSQRAKGMLAMGVNGVCAILIIPFNKWLFKELEWKWVFLLCLIHYCATYLSTVALLWSGVVESRPFGQFREFLPVCVLNVAAVCLLNLSLAANSIGVYQLAKMLTVPGTVFVSWLLYGRSYSRETLGALGVMTGGLALALGGRVQIDGLGAIFALAAVGVVCVSGVVSGELQKKYQLDPTVLMYNIMPPQMALLAATTLLLEPVFPGQAGSLWQYSFTPAAVGCIFITSLFAMMLNLSGLWVLGVFSSVTYSVVGYGKTASVLVIGWMVFGDEMTPLIAAGIVCVFVGAYLYNRCK